MYHARPTTYSIVKDQHGPHRHTSTRMLITGSKFEIIDATKRKKGGHFWWPPFLKTGISIPRRSGHPSRAMIDTQLRTFEVAPKLE
jgi:hypothetical protein